MTRKLFYENALLTEFTARVTDCCRVEGGWEVTLDATGFYPEGGGQPCDLGILGGAKVLDVRENGEEVIHLVDQPISGEVEGKIDFERRFDLMQQHSGEHMVSGVVSRRYGWHNVGFHMGAELITIDFDGPIPARELPAIEDEVNRAIWQNLPIRCWVPSPEELPGVTYRSKRALPWPVRIVEVSGMDSCACCGVHVPSTGMIGLVKLFSCVKFHQGVRIEMACGGRAMKILNEIYEQNRLVSQTFSAKMPETGIAAQKMNERLAAVEFRCNGLEKRIFDAIAAGYEGRGNVLHFEEGLSPTALRELADRIGSVCGGIAAVFSPIDGGHAVAMVSKGGDLRELGRSVNQTLSGRGGGRDGFFQGSVQANRAQIEGFFVASSFWT